MLGTCYDEAFGTEAWGGEGSIRRKRAFDDLVEAEARKLETVDDAVDFFVAKTDFWNRRIFDELVSLRKEAANERKVFLEEMREIVNASAVATQTVFHDFFSSDIILFWKTYHSGDTTTRIGDLTFFGWLWKMFPGIWMSGVSMGVVGAMMRVADAASAEAFAKKHGIELNACQKVKYFTKLQL